MADLQKALSSVGFFKSLKRYAPARTFLTGLIALLWYLKLPSIPYQLGLGAFLLLVLDGLSSPFALKFQPFTLATLKNPRCPKCEKIMLASGLICPHCKTTVVFPSPADDV